MKKTITILSALGFMFASAQEIGYGKSVNETLQQRGNFNNKMASEDCGAVVINDTDEQTGVFIIGNNGQAAAVDIPIESNQKITINSINVTLSSKEEPTFVNFVFYKNTVSPPPKEEGDPGNQNVPGDVLFEVNDATIESYEVIGYEEMHKFYVRNIKLKLAEPIVLDGSTSDGRIWLGVKSDADAWANTVHWETGEGVIAESIALHSDKSGWYQLLGNEGLYEFTADCEFLAASETEASAKVNISPNPAQDYFEYKNLNSLKIISTEIYDATGNLVKSVKGQSKIKIADLKSGVYFIKSKTSSHVTLSNKLIKK